MRRWPGRLAPFVVAAACSVPDVDYTGKTCAGSCPAPFVCVASICQLGPDAGGDAALDTATSDSPTDGPATTDTGTDAGFVCGDAQFCDDFERTTVKGMWDVPTSNEGSLAIIPDGDAGNHVLQVTLLSNATLPVVTLEKTLATTVTWFQYALRLYVHANVNQFADLVTLSVDEPDGTLGQVFFELVGTGKPDAGVFKGADQHTQFDASPFTMAYPSSMFQFDTWNTIVAQCDLKARTVTFIVNGATAGSMPLGTSVPNWQPGTGVHFTIGVLSTDAMGGFLSPASVDIRYDDVAVTYSP